MLDVFKLTMEERRDILWAILPTWVGPLELPGTGDGKKCLAIMPMCSEKPVNPGVQVGISAAVNRAFKPHRLIIQEPTYTYRCWVKVPTKRWHRPRPDVEHTEERIFARNNWAIDCFFIGDGPAMLKYGVVNGDAFGPVNCLDNDWPTAQLGHIISFRVEHHGLAAVPFRSILLGTVIKREMVTPFEPYGDLKAVE